MMVVYVPFFQTIFKTEQLMAFDWCMVIAISSLPLWATEIIKAIRKQTAVLQPA
jgi:hypothetical protein